MNFEFGHSENYGFEELKMAVETGTSLADESGTAFTTTPFVRILNQL